MAIYESIVILDSLIPPKEIDSAMERFSALITENNGKVRQVEKWGKKRLAYEIQKKQYGFYASIEFEGEGNIPVILESEYNYNDNVLRYLTYRYDKYKLKAMASETPAVNKAEKVEPKKKPVIDIESEEPEKTDFENNDIEAEADSDETVEENKE
ncbi:MAG: 30S ribosomal protein S6 [Calditrichaceae bacterium]|nr:30S ribosomal protein S6 [Calditrichaceae bacterium]